MYVLMPSPTEVVLTSPQIFTAATAPRYRPGIYALLGMLAAAAAIVCYLWYRLGGSSEYRGPSQEQMEQTVGSKKDIESLTGDRQSMDHRPAPAELVDDNERR